LAVLLQCFREKMIKFKVVKVQLTTLAGSTLILEITQVLWVETFITNSYI